MSYSRGLIVTALAAGALVFGSAMVEAGPTAVLGPAGSCTTTDPYLPRVLPGDDLLFRPIPVGCDLTNGGRAFSFLEVPDLDAVLHTVTIFDLVFYQPDATDDGRTFVSGSVDGVPFSGVDSSSGGSDTVTLLTGAQALGRRTLAEIPILVIDWGDPMMSLRLADGTVGLFEQLVEDNGDGTYDVSSGGAFVLAVTLDGGRSFVAEDPAFALEPFATGRYPEFDALLAGAVPEPGTFALCIAALGALFIAGGRRVATIPSYGANIAQ